MYYKITNTSANSLLTRLGFYAEFKDSFTLGKFVFNLKKYIFNPNLTKGQNSGSNLTQKIMSQDNSFIITKSSGLQIPREIPHFLVGDDIYLPINIPTGYEFNDFINSVISNKKFDIADYYSGNFYFIELIRKLNISSFVAYHSSEFGTMTLNYYNFTVVDGAVIEKSIWSTEEGIITPENYSEVEENYDNNNSEILLNITIDGFFIEQLKYFEIAESLYKKWGNSLLFAE